MYVKFENMTHNLVYTRFYLNGDFKGDGHLGISTNSTRSDNQSRCNVVRIVIKLLLASRSLLS